MELLPLSYKEEDRSIYPDLTITGTIDMEKDVAEISFGEVSLFTINAAFLNLRKVII